MTNTIEDRILLRLYDRINVFRESIGDLEEILGEVTEKIMIDLLDPGLTDEERERKSAIAELAIQNTQKQQHDLEQEAVNLIGFSDYILDHIKDSRQKGRWLSGQELRAMVEDFFARKYPGTKIDAVSQPDSATRITLSEEAKRALGYFIADTKPSTRTRLHQSGRPIVCIFDPRQAQDVATDAEFIEPSHPLIRWIRTDYEADQSQLHRVVALRLSAEEAGVPPGDYVFNAHRWAFSGIKSDQLLSFRALRLGDRQPLSAADSKSLVTRAARGGQPLPNAVNIFEDLDEICHAAVHVRSFSRLVWRAAFGL